MKLEAEVKIITPKANFKPADNISINIDCDYCTDGDDIISIIENEFWEKYGVNMHYSEDFEISNYSELCSELFD